MWHYFLRQTVFLQVVAMTWDKQTSPLLGPQWEISLDILPLSPLLNCVCCNWDPSSGSILEVDEHLLMDYLLPAKKATLA